jgi:cell division protein FtsZ
MIHFDMPPQKSNIIKVLGFGGGGGNAVNFMYGQNIQNVDFIVCNTDAQALALSDVPNKIQLGPHLTSGLGAGANPNIGKQATEESLEEIRKMLEVNTKMAFITAGMGGGTGTGGAPIVAKICRDLGILTVGIVTTPFGYEGPRRMAQAQAGVAELKEQVDTLLVISNDKLRHQFGNLKMKEAFAKADDVLCTAAKCITDVINSTGQINVDFSDVCTVMRDGGVAILGSAQVGGENRAQEAIEAAANSPLLNDNDIAGAKWILLNITSSNGEYEYTMDEVEVIQNYLRQQTGEESDIILGMGYDDTLGDKIGITLIATGFDHKDPFVKPQPKKEAAPAPIIMTLGIAGEEKKMETPAPEPAPERQTNEMIMPLLKEEETDLEDQKFGYPGLTRSLEPTLENPEEENPLFDDKPVVFELSIDMPASSIDTTVAVEAELDTTPELLPKQNIPVQRELFDFLNKPANVYVQESKVKRNPELEKETPKPTETSDEEMLKPTLQIEIPKEDLNEGLTISFDEPVEKQPEQMAPKKTAVVIDSESIEADLSEEEMQKKRAQERIVRLRNLSYNSNFDGTNAFEDTPAYVRRNLELHNTIANVEDFYSRATVKGDDENKGTISTLNNFLHGEKPD